MSDTREAVARAIAVSENADGCFDTEDADPNDWASDYSTGDEEDRAAFRRNADAAIAAYEANPPDWLRDTLRWAWERARGDAMATAALADGIPVATREAVGLR